MTMGMPELMAGIGMWIETIWGVLQMMGIATLIPYFMGTALAIGFAFAVYHRIAG